MPRPISWIVGRISESSDYQGTKEYLTRDGSWSWNPELGESFAAEEAAAKAAEIMAATQRPTARVVRLETLPVTVNPDGGVPRKKPKRFS